jgi:hypothetical protein
MPNPPSANPRSQGQDIHASVLSLFSNGAMRSIDHSFKIHAWDVAGDRIGGSRRLLVLMTPAGSPHDPITKLLATCGG